MRLLRWGMLVLLSWALLPAATGHAGAGSPSQPAPAACPLPATLGPSTAACDEVGSSHMAATYGFGSECSLQEGARRLLAFGSRVIKVSLWDAAARYRFGACRLTGATPAATPLSVAQTPDFQTLFGMPFTTFVMMTFSSVGPDYWRQGVTDAQCLQEDREMYDLSAHLLRTYAGTRKQFVIQNWEGDWAVRGAFDPNTLPTPTAVNGMIRWFNCRQSGIERARTEIPSDVRVLQGCEVNLVERAVKGEPGTVTNDVLPHTRCDLASYSAWDTIGFAQVDIPGTRARIRAALDHLARRIPDPTPYVRAALCAYPQNVYVGELGWPENVSGTENAMEVITTAIEESVRWGARWTLYWQLYDNELQNQVPGRPGDGDVKGYWMVKPSGATSAAGEYLRGVLTTPRASTQPACPPPPPPAPPAAPPAAAQDRLAPRLSHLRLRRRAVLVRTSEPARLTAWVQRRAKRWRLVKRRSVVVTRAGKARIKLRTTLRDGRYRVRVRARDAAGNRSRLAQRRSTLKRRRHSRPEARGSAARPGMAERVARFHNVQMLGGSNGSMVVFTAGCWAGRRDAACRLAGGARRVRAR